MGLHTATLSSTYMATRPAQGTQALRKLYAVVAPARGVRPMMAKLNANRSFAKMARSNGSRAFELGRGQALPCQAAATTSAPATSEFIEVCPARREADTIAHAVSHMRSNKKTYRDFLIRRLSSPLAVRVFCLAYVVYP